MLSCSDLAHKHASDYLDGQLRWHRRLDVWFHLRICKHCRRFINQFHQIPSVLRAKPLDTQGETAAKALGEQLAETYKQQQNIKK